MIGPARSTPPARRGRLARWLSFRRRRETFAGDARGHVALEFALIGPAMFLVFFSILEFSLLALRVITLDGALAGVSRTIYTGAGATQEEIENEICSQLVLFNNCEANLHIEAIEITSFNAPPTDDSVQCVDASDTSFMPANQFQTGGGGSIVFLRVCAITDLLLPFAGLGSFLDQTPTGRYQVVSSIAFRNEPF